MSVDPDTHDPAAEPEFVAGGMMGDDFCIDQNAGVAYIATHRQNTIDRVSLEPSENSDVRHSVAGDPFTELMPYDIWPLHDSLLLRADAK